MVTGGRSSGEGGAVGRLNSCQMSVLLELALIVGRPRPRPVSLPGNPGVASGLAAPSAALRVRHCPAGRASQRGGRGDRNTGSVLLPLCSCISASASLHPAGDHRCFATARQGAACDWRSIPALWRPLARPREGTAHRPRPLFIIGATAHVRLRAGTRRKSSSGGVLGTAARWCLLIVPGDATDGA